ncbi:hypothetical protein EI555_000026 [Monodon monoceros]|uniref:Uncharacterized protein n=1 Tax=Monodon monoceros TaxID=40151 RepID=A0A4U1FMS3_MONMO|nr:hypothetical protein EI555_000026 [Monodon monoceros]
MPHSHTIRPQDSDGPQDLPFEQVQGNPGLMSAALVDRLDQLTKTELSLSDMSDLRLQSKVFKLVDTSYGGKNGFNQGIEISTEVLSNVKLIQEKKLIERYFDDVSQRDVPHWQSTGEDKIVYQLQRKRRINLILQTKRHDKNMSMMPLLEWFADNYKKKFGAMLEIVTDKAQEGSQSVKGFGAIGGILQYRADFQGMEYQGGDNEFFDFDDY